MPQIAAIVVTANQVDIDAGKLAESKSQSKDVKQFAQQMVTDHTGVNKSATDLVTKLKVKPEENDTSKSLQKGGDDNLANLRKLSGAEFDRGLHRARSRLSPSRSRCDGQDAHPGSRRTRSSRRCW